MLSGLLGIVFFNMWEDNYLYVLDYNTRNVWKLCVYVKKHRFDISTTAPVTTKYTACPKTDFPK